MRWKTAWGCALLLASALGCPHAFGRGGTIDRAVHKDLMEQLKNGSCSKEDREIHCPVGGSIEECLDQCG
jgi:hypothetical protein